MYPACRTKLNWQWVTVTLMLLLMRKATRSWSQKAQLVNMGLVSHYLSTSVMLQTFNQYCQYRFMLLEAEFKEMSCCGKGCIQAVAAEEGSNEVMIL